MILAQHEWSPWSQWLVWNGHQWIKTKIFTNWDLVAKTMAIVDMDQTIWSRADLISWHSKMIQKYHVVDVELCSVYKTEFSNRLSFISNQRYSTEK